MKNGALLEQSKDLIVTGLKHSGLGDSTVWDIRAWNGAKPGSCKQSR